MDTLVALFNIVMHLDQFLSIYIQWLGNWTYLLLFIVIFCETGLVITPFLPGDSLLFAIGLTTTVTPIDINIIAPLLVLAALCGDSCNYYLGKLVGRKIFKDNAKILNTKHLDKAESYFEKYGPRSIIIARFVPIVRTFMPFSAGISRMKYKKFLTFSFVGAFVWVFMITYLGHFFSNNIFVKKYFGICIILIILLSILPPIFSLAKSYLKNKK